MCLSSSPHVLRWMGNFIAFSHVKSKCEPTDKHIHLLLSGKLKHAKKPRIPVCGDSQDSIVGPWRKWVYGFNLDWRCFVFLGFMSDNTGHCILLYQVIQKVHNCIQKLERNWTKGRSAFPPWPQNNNVWKLIEIYINKDINSMFYPLNDNIKNIYFTQYI